MGKQNNKKGLVVSGRMSVGRFEKESRIKCQVKQGNRLVDNNKSLASIRPDDFEGSKTVDLSFRGNMLVKNVKKSFEKSLWSPVGIVSRQMDCS